MKGTNKRKISGIINLGLIQGLSLKHRTESNVLYKDSKSHNKSIINSSSSSSSPQSILKQATLKRSLYNSQPSILEKSLKTIKETFRILLIRNKVYDSQSDDEQEEDTNYKVFFVLLGGTRLIKRVYDLFIFFVFYCYIIILSLELMYNNYIFLFNLIVDLIFLIDMILGFFWSYKDINDIEIIDNTKLFKKYISSWFIIDFLVALPIKSLLSSQVLTITIKYDDILLIMIALSTILRFLKSFKFILDSNQTILSSINFLLNKLELSSSKKKIIKYLSLFIIITHFLSCFWIWITYFDYPNWIQIYGNTNNKFEIYVQSVYFVLTTILIIGYGDIMGTNQMEKNFQVFLMLFGLIFYTFIVSNISSIFKSNEEDNIHKDFMFDFLENSKIKYEMNDKIYYRIRLFIENKYNNKALNKSLLLKELPPSIQNELTCIVYEDLICIIKFFKPIKYYRENEFFITQPEFAVRVITCLMPLLCNRNDYLIQENEIIEEMLIIKEGILTIENSTSTLLYLYKGEHFGDVNMMLNLKSDFSLRVKTKKAEILLMNKYDLIQLSKDFKTIFERINYESAYNLEVLKSLSSCLLDEREDTLCKEENKESIILDSYENDDIEPYEKHKINTNKIENNKPQINFNDRSLSIDNNLNIIEEQEDEYSERLSMKKLTKNKELEVKNTLNNKNEEIRRKSRENYTNNFLEKVNHHENLARTKSNLGSNTLDVINESSHNTASYREKHKFFSKKSEYMKEKSNLSISNPSKSSDTSFKKIKHAEKPKIYDRTVIKRRTGIVAMGMKKYLEKTSMNINDPTSFYKENFKTWIIQNSELKDLTIKEKLNLIINSVQDYISK